MMMTALKGQVSTSLDELVHRTDSPFTSSVISLECHKWKHMTGQRIPSTTWSRSKPSCNYRASKRDYVQGIPYYTEGANMGMFQQVSPQHSIHLQGVRWTLRHSLYCGAEVQKILSKCTEH